MPYIQTNDSFLLKNHGALTIGNTLEKAYFLMESTEFFAKVSMYCRQLGGAQQLDCDQINRLLELRKEFGVPGAHPGCPQCEVLPGSAVPVNSACLLYTSIMQPGYKRSACSFYVVKLLFYPINN